MTAPAPRAATPEDDGQTHWDIAEVGTVCHDECAVAQLRQKRAAPDAGDSTLKLQSDLMCLGDRLLKSGDVLGQRLLDDAVDALAAKERECAGLTRDAERAERKGMETCAALFDGLTWGPYTHPSILIRDAIAIKWPVDAAIDAAKDDANRS